MITAKSDIIALQCVIESCQGGRPENQDDFGVLDTPLGFLCVVCDGMGGGPGGKTASYIAKYEICNTLLACNSMTQRSEALKMAAAKANEALERKMQEVPALRGMGSTFVAILINKDSAIVAHAGDSRCYLMRGKRCLYRSKDHSLVAELVKRKVLTEEQARTSPQSNVINRGLGATSNHVPEIDEVRFSKGDKFILCTDGVWGMMPNNDLMVRLSQNPNIQSMVSNLSQEIDKVGFAKGGGHDNHTIAVIAVEESCRKGGILNSLFPIYRHRIYIAAAIATLMSVASIFIFLNKEKEKIYENENNVAMSDDQNRITPKVYPPEDDKEHIGNTSNHDLEEIRKAIIDSIARADSIRRNDSIARADSIKKDSIAKAKREGNKKSSVNQKNPDVDSPIAIVDGCIEIANYAINLTAQSAQTAKKELNKCQNDINGRLDKLTKITKVGNTKSLISRIQKNVNTDNWDGSVSSKTEKNMHVPTGAFKEKVKGIITDLETLKKKY